MLAKLQVHTRLGIGFGVALCVSVLTGVVAIYYLQMLSGLTTKLYRHPFAVTTTMLAVQRDVISMRRYMQEIALAKSPETINTAISRVDELEAGVIKEFELVTERFLGDKQHVVEARAAFLAWKPIRQEAITLAQAGRNEEAAAAVKGKGAAHVAGLEKTINEIVTFARNKAEAFMKNADASYDQALSMVYSVIGAGLFLTMIFAYRVSRSITQPLGGKPEEIAELVQGVARGELNLHFRNTGSETGIYAATREMVDQLRKMVGQVTQTTDNVSGATKEIAQGSTDLARRTESQAAALEETAAAMEELTSTVKQSADNASQANQLASAARTQAEQGGQVVENAIKAMSEINESSRKISDIIGVIDEIAFQTNLLALNAAVEAARAGEQGRGFAVVASEVRKLAQRSADSAREIKGLIMDSVHRVDEGERLVHRSGETLREIVASSKKVSDIVAEMTAASREQATGIDQVNNAISQMDQATQQNAALVEQTAAASRLMDDQAKQLQQLMGFFQLDGGGSGAYSAPAHFSADSNEESAAPLSLLARRRTPPAPVRSNLREKRESVVKTTSASALRPVAVSNNAQEWEAF